MILSVFALVLGGSREPLPHIGHVHGSLCQPISIYLRVHDKTYIYMQSLRELNQTFHYSLASLPHRSSDISPCTIFVETL